MVESLQDGVHGLTLSIPAGFELMTNEAMVATLVDKQLGVSWHFFFFPDVTLDLSSEAEASLRRGVAHHADHLLQTMSRAERAEMGIPGEVPELSRPALVSCETVSVDGAPALMVLHRMVRRPGREIVMGHLLVPVAEGLFEARWLALTEMTGLRESVLLAKALGTSDPTMEPARAGEAGAMKLGLIQVEEDGRSIDESKRS